jgi:hypothetical protein
MLKRHRFLLFAVVAVMAVAIGVGAIWGACAYTFSKCYYGPSTVHVKEYNTWQLCIKISGAGLSDLVITDVIPAELDLLDYSASLGTVEIKGSDKSATHITWTIPGPLPDTFDTTLIFHVATRLSPSGKFYRFTSPGCYYLNEGAHMVGLRDCMPWCDDSNGITVTVLP